MNFKKDRSISKINFDKILLTVVIIIGVTFSIVQFLYNRSLWLDESFLALNFIERNFFELLKPLSYLQVAPIFFLWVEKLATILLGPTEYALRIFPLLCYWGAIYFFYRILKMLHLNFYSAVLALLLFIFNGTLIYYSNEVKQYMSDVLVITCMFYFTIKNTNRTLKKYVILGVLGIIGIFLSNVSPIILLCCGAYLLYNDFENGWRDFKYIIAVSFVWIVFFGIYFSFFIYNHPTKNYMVGFWSKWEGGAFLPLNPFSTEFYQFIGRKIYSIFTELFLFGKVGLFFLQLLFILGLYYLVTNKKYTLLLLGILPVVVHLALSSIKLYPFDVRLILYLCPAFIIIMSHGFEYLFHSLEKYGQKIVRSACIVASLFFLFTLFSSMPRRSSEPRECFFYVQNNIKEGDKIYVSHISSFPLWYYIKTSRVDFSGYELLAGGYVTIDGFNKEIDSLTGRVWVVFSDFVEDYNLEHLKTRFDDGKHKLLDKYNAKGVTVLLYEIEK